MHDRQDVSADDPRVAQARHPRRVDVQLFPDRVDRRSHQPEYARTEQHTKYCHDGVGVGPDRGDRHQENNDRRCGEDQVRGPSGDPVDPSPVVAADQSERHPDEHCDRDRDRRAEQGDTGAVQQASENVSTHSVTAQWVLGGQRTEGVVQ